MDHYLKSELYELIKSDASIFDFIQESALDGLWYWDLEQPENEWLNPKFWTVLGYDPEEMPHTAEAWQNIINQDDLKLASTNAEKHFADQAHPYDQEVRYRHKNGQTIWIRCRGMAIRNAEGKPVRMLGAHTDVTDLKEKERELEKSVDHLKTILNSTGDMVFIISENLVIKEYYISNEQNLLISAHKFLNKNVAEIGFPPKAKSIILETVKNAFNTGLKVEDEYSLTIENKTDHYQISVKEIASKSQLESEVVCVIRDVTEKKNANLDLINSRKELDFFFSNSLYGAFFMMLDEPVVWNDEVDKEKALDYCLSHQKITKVNQAMLDQYGAQEKDFIGLTPKDFFPDDIQQAKKLWISLFDKGNYLVESHEKRFDGRDLFIEGHYICLYDEAGRITGHFGLQQDVTDRKHAADLLRISEERNKSYVENAPYSIIVSDARGRILEVNKAAQLLSGFDESDLLKMKIPELWSEETSKKSQGLFEELFKNGKVEGSILSKSKDGLSRYVKVKAVKVSEDRFISFVEDIHDKKLAEEALLDSKLKIQMLLDSTEEAIIGTDENGNCTFCNQSSLNILGYESSADLLGKNLHNLIHHSTHQFQRANPADCEIFKKSLEGNKMHSDDTLLWRSDGQSFPAEIWSYPVFQEKKITGTVVTFIDISERKEAERKYENSQAQYQLLANLTIEGVLLHDQGIAIDYNRSFSKIFGYDDKELINVNVLTKLIFEEDRKTVQSKMAKEETSPYIIRGIKKDGSMFPAEIEARNIYYDDRCLRVVAVRDVTERYESQKKLAESQQQLENLTNNVPGVLFQLLSDDTGNMKFTYFSQQMEDYGIDGNGITQDSQNMFKDIFPEDLENFYKSVTGAISKVETWNLEYRVLKENKGKKSIQWFKGQAQPELQEDGTILWSGIIQDITQQKEVQEVLNQEKRRLNNILEGTRVGTWEWNVQTGETVFNDYWALIIGYKLEEISPVSIDTWAQFAHPEDLEVSNRLITEHLEGRSEYYEFESRMKHKNGEWVWVLDRGKITEWDSDGKPLKMSGTHQDITEKRHFIEALEEAKTMAEAASVAKSDFLANMSHEIRTPLNGVIGFTDLLLRTNLDNIQKQYMSTVQQSATSLLEIINDILDFSKIEAGKLELLVEKTDLLDLGSKISDLIKYQAHKKNLEILLNINGEIPRFIWVDEIRLKQILVNLLGNAVKFTEKGEIELKIELFEKINEQEGVFRFSVRDTGVGIATKNQKKIFDAFSQEDASTTRKFGGTGLGLSISNKLLSMMGSQLQLQSELGKGSTFYFDLKLKVTDGEALNQKCKELHHHFNKILVVDDNKNNQNITLQMLKVQGIEAEAVSNGLEALGKIANGNKYDVVLIDYHMAYLNGIETIRKIRSELNLPPEEQHIVLFHSSEEDGKLYSQCRELGVSQLLVKPVTMQQLCDSLAKLINNPTDTLAVNTEINTAEKDLFLEPVKILIAEDNEINLLLAKTILKDLLPNAIILEAENGKEAIEKYQDHQPDVIFMDIQMPVMNGYDATGEIRSMAKNHLPIIALTAGTVKGEEEKCISAGMDDYVTKPVVRATLQRVIKKWLHQEADTEDAEKSEVNQQLLQVQHFDYLKLEEKLNFDYNFIKSVMEKTVDFLEINIPEMEKHFELGSFEILYEQAHALKGTASSVCFPKLTELAAQLMNACIEKNISDNLPLMAEIAQETQIVIQLIEDLRINFIKYRE